MGFIVKNKSIDVFAEHLLISDRDSGEHYSIAFNSPIDDEMQNYVPDLQYDQDIISVSELDRYLPDGNFFIERVINFQEAENYHVLEGIAIDTKLFFSFLSLPF